MKRLASLILAALLSACAAVPPAPVNIPTNVEQLPTWLATGRIAIAAGGAGGAGSFTWHQDGENLRIALRGPLGAGGLEIQSDGSNMNLRDSSGTSLDAQQASARLRARLGVDLPLSSLRYWMLGMPAPRVDASVTDAAGSAPRVIEQSGWRVDFNRFREVAGFSLPERLTAKHSDVRLRVIIDDWQVPPRSTP